MTLILFVSNNNSIFVQHNNMHNNVQNNASQIGRISDDREEIFEKEKLLTQGWIDIKSIISGKHFRININNKLVVHEHGAEPDSGAVGFKLSGTGSLLISNFEVHAL